MTRLLAALLLLGALAACTDDRVPARAVDALECETTYAKGTGDDDTDPTASVLAVAPMPWLSPSRRRPPPWPGRRPVPG